MVAAIIREAANALNVFPVFQRMIVHHDFHVKASPREKIREKEFIMNVQEIATDRVQYDRPAPPFLKVDLPNAMIQFCTINQSTKKTQDSPQSRLWFDLAISGVFPPANRASHEACRKRLIARSALARRPTVGTRSLERPHAPIQHVADHLDLRVRQRRRRRQADA